jgi:hypothetical protein
VITSKRRTSPSGSSLWSSLDTKRPSKSGSSEWALNALRRRCGRNSAYATMPHGSSSCGEDRLGHSEQPSKAQCRASHPGSAHIRSYA